MLKHDESIHPPPPRSTGVRLRRSLLWAVSPAMAAVSRSRRAIAVAMFACALEALCVVGRVSRPVELRLPEAGAAFVLVERPKDRVW